MLKYLLLNIFFVVSVQRLSNSCMRYFFTMTNIHVIIYIYIFIYFFVLFKLLIPGLLLNIGQNLKMKPFFPKSNKRQLKAETQQSSNSHGDVIQMSSSNATISNLNKQYYIKVIYSSNFTGP